MTEFAQGFKQGLFKDHPLDWLQQVNFVSAEERLLFVNLSKRLGAGEASCLAIAMQRRDDLLTDDQAVRKIALREGLRLSGSIGVLLELIRTSDISLKTGNSILKAFIDQGYFSPVETLDEFF